MFCTNCGKKNPKVQHFAQSVENQLLQKVMLKFHIILTLIKNGGFVWQRLSI